MTATRAVAATTKKAGIFATAQVAAAIRRSNWMKLFHAASATRPSTGSNVKLFSSLASTTAASENRDGSLGGVMRVTAMTHNERKSATAQLTPQTRQVSESDLRSCFTVFTYATTNNNVRTLTVRCVVAGIQ